mgnify:CR=1 FL=1
MEFQIINSLDFKLNHSSRFDFFTLYKKWNGLKV